MRIDRSRGALAGWLLAGALAAAPLPFPAAAQPHDHDHEHASGNPEGDAEPVAANETERLKLLAEAEARLAALDTGGALAALERAANMRHAADTETAIVRAQMQAGAYRNAVAFAAHTAGAHRDLPAGTALYGWLLHLGGQSGPAATLVGRALAANPGDAALRWASAAIAEDGTGSGAPGNAPEPPAASTLRLAPYGNATPEAAAVAATAVLTGADGLHAIAPAAAVRGVQPLWLRDGLGRLAAARVERSDDELGIALLRLETPLPGGRALSPPAREPFAGSPALAVSYRADRAARPGWPRARLGFFGRAEGPLTRTMSGSALSANPGAPVFDAAGRFAGVLAADARLVPTAVLASRLGIARTPAEDLPPNAPRQSVDAGYEAALPLTLQLLVPASSAVPARPAT